MSIITKDYVYKIALVGDFSTGKSSLLRRYADDHFEQTYHPTIGVDFTFKTLQVNQSLIKLQIWDTAGQQRFRNITSAYYKKAQGVIIVFDINNWKTLQSVQNYWLEQTRKYADQQAQIVLIGNKYDKCTQDQMIESRIQKFEQKHNIKVYLCSAKTGQNVKQAFQYLTQLCINRFGSMETQISNKSLDNVQRKKSEINLRSRPVDSHRRRKEKACC